MSRNPAFNAKQNGQARIHITIEVLSRLAIMVRLATLDWATLAVRIQGADGSGGRDGSWERVVGVEGRVPSVWNKLVSKEIKRK